MLRYGYAVIYHFNIALSSRGRLETTLSWIYGFAEFSRLINFYMFIIYLSLFARLNQWQGSLVIIYHALRRQAYASSQRSPDVE